MPLRVLIVDDNRDHADTLAVLARMWGHVPAVAYDGEAGLRAAQEQRPDCLILDINMPGLDGYALAREVRRLWPHGVKLVALSAYSDPDHVRRVEEAGFDFRLTKPAEPAELRRTLSMMEHILRLAEQTEELTQRNVTIAERTEELAERNVVLAGETKELLEEVKEELKEVKEDVRGIKEEIREVREEVRDQAREAAAEAGKPPVPGPGGDGDGKGNREGS